MFDPAPPPTELGTITNFSPISGPLVLAFMLSYMFYGVSIVQIFFYHVHYPKDTFQVKVLAWFVFILETATTVITGVLAWSMFGSGFDNPLSFREIDPVMATFPFINGILASIVQNLLSWRIHKLTSVIWLPAIISCTSLAGCFFSFFYGIRICQIGLHFDSPIKVSKYVDAWIACSATSDIFATTALVTILLRSASKSGFKTSNKIIVALVKFTIETGLITATWAVIQLILWVKMPLLNYHYIFFLGIARLYSNWLLVTLNSRHYIASSGQVITSGHTFLRPGPLRRTDLARIDVADGRSIVHHLGTGVHVSTTTEVKEDREMDITSILPPSEMTDASI
ncbi:hypothetical protein PTI98_013202 [Pleurotus ostreatus]|nr:hypothetical protein PTI98_013202 [Pleurotus ostreatus]